MMDRDLRASDAALLPILRHLLCPHKETCNTIHGNDFRL